MVVAGVVGALWLKARCGNPVAIEVGPETTILMGPLRGDGTVDYLAAINAKMSAGVTVENNAFVGMLPAIGTGEETLGPRWREILRMTGGVESKGCWKKRKFEVKLSWPQGESLLETRGWRAEEYPEADGWLRSNGEAMRIIGEAAKRERYWIPLLATTPDGGMARVSVGHRDAGGFARQLSEAFRYRAMRRLGEKDVAGAWEDLGTAHRLNRLLAQDSMFIMGIIGKVFDNHVVNGDVAVLESGLADRGMLLRILTALQALPAFPSEAETLERSEIYSYSDAVQELAREYKRKGLTAAWWLPAPDWNRMLREGNAFYVEYYGDHHWKSQAEYSAWWEKMHGIVKGYTERMKKTETFKYSWKPPMPTPWQSQRGYTDRLTNYLLAMMTPEISPALRESGDLRMVCIGYAVELYWMDHGKYPESLGELSGYLRDGVSAAEERGVGYTHTADSFELKGGEAGVKVRHGAGG